MAQVTWRASDELVERVRAVAGRGGYSMNEFVTRVLDAATDPAVAGDEAARIRERLERAGLLATPLVDGPAPRPRADPEALRAARRRAGQGTPLADLIAADRE
ncbi:MAG TPA: transcriptional regulator [Pseudonocardia sp.]|jgi:hypothetical protein|uniref:transcriptional regulator n=1 Tax=Pseudonocardia sp. TaxID=60912 RepID=UPI002EDB6EDA